MNTLNEIKKLFKSRHWVFDILAWKRISFKRHIKIFSQDVRILLDFESKLLSNSLDLYECHYDSELDLTKISKYINTIEERIQVQTLNTKILKHMTNQIKRRLNWLCKLPPPGVVRRKPKISETALLVKGRSFWLSINADKLCIDRSSFPLADPNVLDHACLHILQEVYKHQTSQLICDHIQYFDPTAMVSLLESISAKPSIKSPLKRKINEIRKMQLDIERIEKNVERRSLRQSR